MITAEQGTNLGSDIHKGLDRMISGKHDTRRLIVRLKITSGQLPEQVVHRHSIVFALADGSYTHPVVIDRCEIEAVRGIPDDAIGFLFDSTDPAVARIHYFFHAKDGTGRELAGLEMPFSQETYETLRAHPRHTFVIAKQYFCDCGKCFSVLAAPAGGHRILIQL